MSLLELRNVTLRFGGLTAIKDVTLSVPKGSIFSVIGPNGAGKTSLFNVITGVYEPSGGAILFHGRELRRPVAARTVAGVLLIGVLSAMLLFCALHIERLWEATITNLYVYQEPFPWRSALSAFGVAVGEILRERGWAVPLIGFALGLAGSSLVWTRGRRTPDVVARSGLARTFQNIRLFQEMTLRENVLLGMDRHLRTTMVDALLRLPRYFHEQRKAIGRADELLDVVGLKAQAGKLASTLPYGHQRRLEIARALASEPELLLLDEPAAGMNPSEADSLIEVIRAIRARGITVVLIEHHMRVVMGISDEIAVLDYGNKIAQGTPEEIRANPKVIAAYLGKDE